MKCAFGIHALIGVGSEIIALGLDKIGRQPGAAISIEITHETINPGIGTPDSDAWLTMRRKSS